MRQRADRERLARFLSEMGRGLRSPVRLYLVGGSVLIDLELRSTTLDIDFVVDAEEPGVLAEFERHARALKERLQLNLEIASPADCLPAPSGVRDRSLFVRHVGLLSVYYYHLPSQVIAKAACGFEQDLDDAAALVRSQLVSWDDVEETWQEMEASPTGWLRYEPADVRRRLDQLRRRLDQGDAPAPS